jgi:hypothetical protein
VQSRRRKSIRGLRDQGFLKLVTQALEGVELEMLTETNSQ